MLLGIAVCKVEVSHSVTAQGAILDLMGLNNLSVILQRSISV